MIGGKHVGKPRGWVPLKFSGIPLYTMQSMQSESCIRSISSGIYRRQAHLRSHCHNGGRTASMNVSRAVDSFDTLGQARALP